MRPLILNLGGGNFLYSQDPLSRLAKEALGFVFEPKLPEWERLRAEQDKWEGEDSTSARPEQLAGTNRSRRLIVRNEYFRPEQAGEILRELREHLVSHGVLLPGLLVTEGVASVGKELALDVVKVDIDSIDVVVLESMLEAGFRPSVLVIELLGSHIPPPIATAFLNPDRSSVSVGSGNSLSAFVEVAARFGLGLASHIGEDCIFILDAVVKHLVSLANIPVSISEGTDVLSRYVRAATTAVAIGENKGRSSLEERGGAFGLDEFECFRSVQFANPEPFSAIRSVREQLFVKSAEEGVRQEIEETISRAAAKNETLNEHRSGDVIELHNSWSPDQTVLRLYRFNIAARPRRRET